MIKVLGFQLSCTPLVHVGQDHPLQQAYHTAAQTLRKLPMTVQFRANALAGITLARELWAPLRVLIDGRLAGHIRKHIIAGVAPYLAKGARASAMVCIHCFKGHRIDPVVALVLKLVFLLAKGGQPAVHRVLDAFHDQEVVATPFTLLARYFRMLQLKPVDQGWRLHCGLWVSSLPTDSIPKWQHDWRVLIRHAALIHGTSHRREFVELPNHPIDELKTMAYHRPLPAGRLRAALEVVLS